jgi:hypothetical protein
LSADLPYGASTITGSEFSIAVILTAATSLMGGAVARIDLHALDLDRAPKSLTLPVLLLALLLSRLSLSFALLLSG